jgi:hypothetical protein
MSIKARSSIAARSAVDEPPSRFRAFATVHEPATPFTTRILAASAKVTAEIATSAQ